VRRDSDLFLVAGRLRQIAGTKASCQLRILLTPQNLWETSEVTRAANAKGHPPSISLAPFIRHPASFHGLSLESNAVQRDVARVLRRWLFRATTHSRTLSHAMLNSIV